MANIYIKMKVLVVISALVAISSGAAIKRSVAPIVIINTQPSALLGHPQVADSAIVQNERLGGNFAYAIAEGSSFQTVSPLVATNLRAIDSLGLSYAIQSIPILTAPATILLPQPTSEQEQREQQAHRDLAQAAQDELQKQQDQLQHIVDQQREEEQRQVLAIQQQQQDLVASQEEQQQLVLLQQQELLQQQQNLVGSTPIVTSPIATVPVPAVIGATGPTLVTGPTLITGPTQVATGPTSSVPTTTADGSVQVTDDSVIVENPSLAKSDASPEDQPNQPEEATVDSQSEDIN